MARNRVSLLDRDEAPEICTKIKAKHGHAALFDVARDVATSLTRQGPR